MTVQVYETSSEAQQKLPVKPLISGEQAVHNATNYLLRHVGMYFRGTEPTILQLDKVVWQVLVVFKRHSLGPFHAGFIDIDAATGDVFPLGAQQIAFIRNRTDAFIALNAPHPEP
ncbi:MAG: hypothetical protein KDE54_15215 [Caldilineaceae bacterium]|nr:hypothetical protein [Caldilineaceae bacterium]MCB0095608.1 hypothetical protein [Caldilineaceae bacterium]MCB0143447.1 hypothetical protein [Caldilineaceae bacterium]